MLDFEETNALLKQMLARRRQIAEELPVDTVRKIRRLVNDPKRPMTVVKVAIKFDLPAPVVHMLCTPNNELRLRRDVE